MNGELWARGSAATDPIIPGYSWDNDGETEQSPKPKKHKQKQLFLKTRNGNNRRTGQQCTPTAEEGYCNEATQSGPLTYSQSHQAKNKAEHTEVKKGSLGKKRKSEK
jgi:hypothetical protein